MFQLFTTCPGGWWVGDGWEGVLDDIKAILSPAGDWRWAELGKIV